MKTLVQKKDLIPSTYFKTNLLKDWKKAGPDTWIELCDHEHTHKWDCGCSFGCDLCNYDEKCDDCGCLLHNSNRKLYSARLYDK